MSYLNMPPVRMPLESELWLTPHQYETLQKHNAKPLEPLEKRGGAWIISELSQKDKNDLLDIIFAHNRKWARY